MGRSWSKSINLILHHNMEEKIQKELEAYGFTKDMLTAEELKKLEEEILLIEQGYFIMDGVLSNIPRYSRERELKMKS